jgi:hypothetical protein
MALIAVAADKGAPGVSTASLALAAVWPRPVLLAEADPAGGDLVYRLPSADGGRLDPRRGLLSLAVAARRGIQPHQVWEHTQKVNGGLDVLTGVANAEQAGGLQLLWGKIGQVLAAIPQLDVVADCGRLGMDGPFYDLLGYTSSVVLVARPNLEGVIRLRDRVAAAAAALAKRGLPGAILDVVIVADYKQFRQATAEVGSALEQGNVPGRVVGGLAYEPKGAEMLRGEWGGKLDKSMLIRTAREVAAQLVAELPVLPGAAHPGERPRPQHPEAGQLRGGPTGQWPAPPPPQHPAPATEPAGQVQHPVPPPAHHAEPQQPQPPASPGPPSPDRRPGRSQPQHQAAPGVTPQDQGQPPQDRLVAGQGREQVPPVPPHQAGQAPGHPQGLWPAQDGAAAQWSPSRPGQPAPQQPRRPEGPSQGRAAMAGQDSEEVQTMPLPAPTQTRRGSQPSESHHAARPPAGPGQAVPRSGRGGDG